MHPHSVEQFFRTPNDFPTRSNYLYESERRCRSLILGYRLGYHPISSLAHIFPISFSRETSGCYHPQSLLGLRRGTCSLHSRGKRIGDLSRKFLKEHRTGFLVGLLKNRG